MRTPLLTLHPAGLSLRHLAILLTLFLAALASAGCGRLRQQPYLEPDAEGNPIQVKRVARYPEVDLFHRWSSRAYYPEARHNIPRYPSDDQQAIIDEHGRPEFVRKHFESQYGERTDEWVYVEEGFVAQFVGGALVYAGAVTDTERTLIERGYPNECVNHQEEIGPASTTFVYRHHEKPFLDNYTFKNGVLVGKED